MEMIWSSNLEELKKGFTEGTEVFTCLLCEKSIEKGIIYPYEGFNYEAERFMRIHIQKEHGSVFEYLIGLNKKLTGLTDHQKNLLNLFYQGKSDKEIQTELEIGSPSTIRHHRFALKEKERQARIFLTLMELLDEKDQHAPAFVPIHKTATMVDERYNITQEEQTSIVEKFFKESKLNKFPPKEKQRLVVLREIAAQLQKERIYKEKELNEEISKFYEDYVLIRRYLIDYGFLTRKNDGSAYWLEN
ncbi:DUF2087 domain-containing protein [Sutcliffiella rhizosphaerae]|uniref:DUF2087 domain-containing protein n=1 Tax=Sutcliffiella rhizosphaerae TaxID=2880967 RepID=A0ABM8YMR9_9BACI|nr:DUF2087 domain-containing protein [Sutcliffiella rhizosphaerae]CAG9621119.1 hypothetical protein BACCIP111883_01891 [Sutcliffiella rhizosphaerae]